MWRGGLPCRRRSRVTSSVRSAALARDSARRALAATRTTKVWPADPAASTRPLPMATLRPPERMPSRRAVEALTMSRADIVHCVEQIAGELQPAARDARRAQLRSQRDRP